MANLSFKNKLFVMTLCVVSLCAVAIVALTISEHGRLYKDSAKQALIALSSNSAEDLVPFLAHEPANELSITSYLLKFERYEHITSARVYDRHLNLASQYVNSNLFDSTVFRQSRLSSDRIRLGLSENDNEFISTIEIGDAELKLGYLVVALDFRQALTESESMFYSQLFPMVIAVLIVTLILVHWLLSGLLQPLLNLGEVVDKVHRTADYRLRFKDSGDDEISHLGRNLNNMLSTIDKHNIETVAHNRALEAQQKSLEYLANYDQLTKLPNRKLFQELLKQELSRIRRNKTELAVMFIDLDDFKTVNDTMGHHAGDLLLSAASKRIGEQLRNSDILARLGGDEFVVVATDLNEEIEAIAIAERILNVFKELFDLDTWQVHSGLSIGIAFSDADKIDLPSLIANADLAMYRAKRLGRGRYAVFEEEMQSNQHRRMNIVNQLNNALRDDEFELYYQPKISPQHGVVGLEALIRWTSKIDGPISPGEFIPIAEHCGKVHDITRWVLAKGLADMSEISKQLTYVLKTSFNISAYDIAKQGFIDFITELIASGQVDAKDIEFEVTESAYIENFNGARRFFEELEKLNCNIALDDFGTGYSSLSYLTQIKADTLKIDQQFIRKIFASEQERQIVDSIISLAKNLKLEICAEGVETKEQYEYLSAAGCHLIQGYYFSKPVPLNQVVSTVTEINQRPEFTTVRGIMCNRLYPNGSLRMPNPVNHSSK